MIYIGVDPGVRECGVAIEALSGAGHRCAYRAFLVGGTLAEMGRDIRGQVPLLGALSICVEGQQFYGTERSKGDPNDLIRLAQVAGAVLGGLLTGRPDATYSMPLPRQWKGSTPKAIHHTRLARDYPHWVGPVARDTPKSKQHHVWDAVGLLEWHKERSNS